MTNSETMKSRWKVPKYKSVYLKSLEKARQGHSDNWREKVSDSVKEFYKQNPAKALENQKKSNETRQKNNSYAKQAESLKKRYLDAEYRKVASCRIKKAMSKQEVRDKISNKIKELWQNHEYREKMKVSRKNMYDDKFKEKISKAADKMWKDEEYVKKQEKSLGKRDNIKKHIHGYFKSLGSYIMFQSSYELLACLKLERMLKEGIILNWGRCDFSITYFFKGKARLYFPDFLIEYKNNDKSIVEVKPKNRVSEEMNKAKFESLFVFAEKNNFNAEIWTEEDIQ